MALSCSTLLPHAVVLQIFVFIVQIRIVLYQSLIRSLQPVNLSLIRNWLLYYLRPCDVLDWNLCHYLRRWRRNSWCCSRHHLTTYRCSNYRWPNINRSWNRSPDCCCCNWSCSSRVRKCPMIYNSPSLWRKWRSSRILI